PRPAGPPTFPSRRSSDLGGVSQLDAEPPTPRAEALIAAVGPLTSFGIAGLCFTAERAVGGLPWLHAVTGYLAAVNLVIGVFNLLDRKSTRLNSSHEWISY